VKRFTVAAADAGRRLDVVVARLTGLSRNAAQRLIVTGRVTVDGRRPDKHDPVRVGQVVAVEPPPAGEPALTLEAASIDVVYEDDALLVVDKPAGMVVHPAAGHEHGTLVQALLDHGPAGGHPRRPGIVHRLDKDTSGLLVVARDEVAYRVLVDQMARRRIEREYVALVVGRFPQDEGTVDAPIGRHIRDRKRMSVHTSAPRRAVTHFAVERRLSEYTLLALRLETGRTHQIRVHLAALGYPVAGDAVYGRAPRPRVLRRQFLHARRLAFPHPLAPEQRLEFTSSLPAELAEFLDTLE